MTKNLPAMQETWVWSLGQEDPLEKRMATHSSILAWRIPWTEKSGSLHSPWGQTESDTTEPLTQRLWAVPWKILPCDSVSLPWETSCVQGNWQFHCAHLRSFSEAGNCQHVKGDMCHPAAEQGSTITLFIWEFLTVQASFQKFSVEFSGQK